MQLQQLRVKPFDCYWNELLAYLIIKQKEPLPPIMWVHHWVIAYARIYIDPNLKIGDRLTLVNKAGTEYIYIIKEQDEETLEWKLVWPD